MTLAIRDQNRINERVRAIILTNSGRLLLIKRVKPHAQPYWVAPGGGVEDCDTDLFDTLHREVCEELGGTIEVIRPAFTLEHTIAGKNLREHFFICRLLHYDLEQRNGPEFNDPTRGEYIPVEISLNPDTIQRINIKTPELQNWLQDHIADLRELSNKQLHEYKELF